jgi:biopolymer transport protein ExbB
MFLFGNVFMEFVTEEWYFAFPLFIMTLIAATLAVWRIWLNFNAKTDLNLFMPRLQEVMAREGIEGGLKFCKAQPPTEPIPSKLFVAALENARQGAAAQRKSMAHVVEMEVLPDLNFLLPSILGLAKIATMVGLLFTIISMIGTFSALASASGEGDQKKASGKIGLALFATMFGLLTAIPLVFLYTLDKAWIQKFERKMKNAGTKLLLMIQASKAGTLTAPPPPGQGPPGAAPRPPQGVAVGAR